MHLQVRTSVRSGSGGSLGAAVAPNEAEPIAGDPVGARPHALHEVLQLLREGGFNLRVASGRAIETTGEFVFAVGPEDDDEHERQTRNAAALLRDRGYPSRIVRARHIDVRDQVGALDDALGGLPPDELVNEIFVGTPNGDGTIPLQITTIRVAPGT